MYMGGWKSASEVGQPDRLYYSDYRNGWQPIQPVRWTNPGYTHGQIAGCLVNDPTVVKHPHHNWLFMYFISLPTWSTHEFRNHQVHFASSGDGVHWYHHGPILWGGGGAWSPSAININGALYIYYNNGVSGYNRVYRQRISWNGWQKIGGRQNIVLPMVGNQHDAHNVDVEVRNNVVYMAANDLSIRSIVKYESQNGGTHFYKNSRDSHRIVNCGVHCYALTPNILFTGDGGFQILFGYDPVNEWVPHLNSHAPLNSRSIQSWFFSL